MSNGGSSSQPQISCDLIHPWSSWPPAHSDQRLSAPTNGLTMGTTTYGIRDGGNQVVLLVSGHLKLTSTLSQVRDNNYGPQRRRVPQNCGNSNSRGCAPPKLGRRQHLWEWVPWGQCGYISVCEGCRVVNKVQKARTCLFSQFEKELQRSLMFATFSTGQKILEFIYYQKQIVTQPHIWHVKPP